MNGDRLIDRWDAFADRYSVPLAVFGFAWMALGWASHARFIELPVWPLLAGISAIIAGVVFNAVWWGFLYPRVQRRRKERELASDPQAGYKIGGPS